MKSHGKHQGKEIIYLFVKMETNRRFRGTYSCVEQDEIQSAHWDKNQISVFTAVCWVNGQTESYALISDYREHNKCFVDIAIKTIIADLKNKHSPHIIDFFTDGAASQFKQKYTLNNMTLINDIECTWHFFATSHGKGAVDGIGGGVKRKASILALSGRMQIQNAEQFVSALRMGYHKSLQINLILIPENAILQNVEEFDKKSGSSTVCLPELRKIHFVRSVSQNVVKYAYTTDAFQTKTHCFQPHVGKENRKSETDTAPPTVPMSINVECEKLYAVHYVDRFYVGRVLKKCEEENFYTMKFLHKATVGGQAVYKWPKTDDIDHVHVSNIFFGPVKLEGVFEFSIPALKEIEGCFSKMK